MKKIVFSSILSTMLIPCIFTGWVYAENKHPYEMTKGKDSIEWACLWNEPRTREEGLERVLTTELQRRILFALQEKKYLKPGKENVYYFDPFKVTDIREDKNGISIIDVLVSVHRVINSKPDHKAEKFRITFRHDYDLGFVVIGCQKIEVKNTNQ
ncbi:hypothetical protein [Aneurinibacillus migulanus]|uniref:hypothetical protein n=1 Tax=Aneurinibacillus migulanus TaxID=47500 RepID=UPI00209F1DBA|nr:hypothetical protein [Aneurinibacillus migulanus]MCP1357238.1 hypothetical protein [Aneurinibacillus migulanus]